MKPGLKKTAETLRKDLEDGDPYALALQTVVQYGSDHDYGITEAEYADAIDTIKEEQAEYRV